ncbi:MULTISPECIES: MBL fold metallo-hydrolase [Methanobacterium]|uniref:MBL fold metallo-hydrolase n=1 Tax=Methanobacterium veterum TaxID=408577 RepID=A0A9E5DNG4_9EURY|nr:MULTISPECIES: MBL fold metallo-hydrolase [Methanobacterium]MCZ3367023.1 MBL fold metallo-hydrolase [Methanobacterium veterum]MCZ3373830.1 MBL fold metallo-hydrolase [Methanobacterium veterum]
MEDWFKVKKVADKTWAIHDKTQVACYLVEGEEKAILIDTCWGLANLAELVQSITSLPVKVVITHGHPDHVCGAFQFSDLYISNEDKGLLNAFYNKQTRRQLIENRFKDQLSADFSEEKWINAELGNVSTIKEGDVFELGKRDLKVIAVPGHTPGSICLLDGENELLFSGDSVQTAPVLMHLDTSLQLSTYFDSLVHVCSFEEEYDRILPGHGETPLDKAVLYELIDGVSEILEGNVSGILEQTFFGEGLVCKFNETSIIYNENQL